MRRILIPLVFVALLTMAAIVPVAADSGSQSGTPTAAVATVPRFRLLNPE